MKLILNLLWLVLSGFWMALGYIAAGIVCCLLIVTIPFGIASFRIAVYALWPFGRRAVRRDSGPLGDTLTMVGNVIWFLVAGLWLAIGHITTGIALCVTIIGIPLGIGSFKMVPISLLPLGRVIVDSDQPLVPR
ncbi:YccF domain-containing protein [Nocardioides bruguierae]|uniref:YccF domain-containing protein n=1 Tax=Nocardioides bruguierae TaxID=2945102 RepID=A0A9X2D7J7_9ACTN|nr:YccF domain-containing protein [Nocardioides bruguierae]MCL8025638.1 YccF domain-containing protein [Nocardioides bruguierae]MCM0620494.1 YccF domain-containing protein [Nocardioides bruguierae]